MKKVLIAGLALSLASTQAVAQTQFRVVSAFPSGTPQSGIIVDFIDHVNKQCSDVKLLLIGGPEAVPTYESGDAVRRGVVDIAYTANSFYSSLLPEIASVRLSTNSVSDQCENGAWEYLNRLHNEKMNVQYLARVADGVPFHLYFTREVDPLNLSGVPLQGGAAHRAFLDALGATMIQSPPGEMYTNLERGVAVGYAWVNFGIFDFGWAELTKYRVEPGYYVADAEILVNLDRWNALSEAGRACLNGAAAWIEGRADVIREFGLSEIERQNAAGIKAIVLEGERRAEFLKRANDAGWAELKRNAPEHAARLRELMAPGSEEK